MVVVVALLSDLHGEEDTCVVDDRREGGRARSAAAAERGGGGSVRRRPPLSLPRPSPPLADLAARRRTSSAARRSVVRWRACGRPRAWRAGVAGGPRSLVLSCDGKKGKSVLKSLAPPLAPPTPHRLPSPEPTPTYCFPPKLDVRLGTAPHPLYPPLTRERLARAPPRQQPRFRGSATTEGARGRHLCDAALQGRARVHPRSGGRGRRRGHLGGLRDRGRRRERHDRPPAHATQ